MGVPGCCAMVISRSVVYKACTHADQTFPRQAGLVQLPHPRSSSTSSPPHRPPPPSLHPEQAEPRSSTFRRPLTPRWTIPEPLADPSIQIIHLDHLNHVHVTDNHRSTSESAFIGRLTLPAPGAVHAPMLLLHPSTCCAVHNGGGVVHPVHVVRYTRLGDCQ